MYRVCCEQGMSVWRMTAYIPLAVALMSALTAAGKFSRLKKSARGGVGIRKSAAMVSPAMSVPAAWAERSSGRATSTSLEQKSKCELND